MWQGISDLSTEEVEYAHNFILKRIQRDVYCEEVEDLRTSLPSIFRLTKSSNLIKFSPSGSQQDFTGQWNN
jgi:hypothetical protein